MAGARIVVIEDDETLGRGLEHALAHAGYEVERYLTGEDGWAAIEANPPDLVIQDLMLPGIDGLEVLRRVRARIGGLQVIILTAKGEELDRVLGLELGADDYVTKPYSLRELLARVKARLRSRPSEVAAPSAPAPREFSFGKVTVDLRRRVLARDGKEMRLTTHEAGVLEYLIQNRGRDVSREELLEKVWGYSPNMATRTVDNQILKLRKKVEEVPADPRHILTVHGTGYRFEE